MTTNVGKLLRAKHKVWTSGWIAFVVGSCLGGFIGMRGGAAAATAHVQATAVPIADYIRACDECERMSGLYYAERRRNVERFESHAPVARIIQSRRAGR